MYCVGAKMYDQFNKKKLGLDPTNIEYTIKYHSYHTRTWLDYHGKKVTHY